MDHYYIYCLHNDDLPEYYVGHTKNWDSRWNKHKCESVKSKKHLKVYQYINNNDGIHNFKMEVLDYLFGTKNEAIKLERYYMELLGATLNSDVPGRTKKEYDTWWHRIYRKKNEEQFAEKKKKYYEKNKEEIIAKKKEKFTCICGATTRYGDKHAHFRTKKHINFIRLNIGY